MLCGKSWITSNSNRRYVELRQEKEAQNLASLTDWDINDIRSKITFVQPKPWWRNIWN